VSGKTLIRLIDWFSHLWVGWHVIALMLLMTGCASKDPFKGSYWAETNEGKPAHCTKKGECYSMSDEDWAYFQQQARETGQSEI